LRSRIPVPGRRELVSKYGQDPVYASRTYALLSLAQACAAHTLSGRAGRDKQSHTRSLNAGISAASINLLSRLFPDAIDADRNIEEISRALQSSGLDLRHVQEIIELCLNGTKRVIQRGANDGADKALEVNPPTGRAFWYSFDNLPPLRPYWGSVKPLCVEIVEKYIPASPPGLDTPEFKNALEDVRRKSSNINADQMAMVQHWADGPGTPTPPGHWNLIACEMLADSKKSETERTKILALLNIAMFDAGIACWRTKFKYWLARPSQFDTSIPVRIKVPNFPSYVSGHSAFSGAAATVLGRFLPAQRDKLAAMAQQASQSRVFAGIHFRTACHDGRIVGSEVADYILENLMWRIHGER